MDGKLQNPEQILKKYIQKRINNNKQQIYGEKNVTLSPFISKLYDIFDCKFIFVTRDGRDVVSSLMNWHTQKYGNIYRDCKHPDTLSPEAIKNLKKNPLKNDTCDYSRPRPQKDEDIYSEWENLKRYEMSSYYWSKINETCMAELDKIPKNAWKRINYSTVKPKDIEDLFSFLGLEGYNNNLVSKLLNKKINSLKDRNQPKGKFPYMVDWNSEIRTKFEKIAYNTMVKLNYYNDCAIRWRPPNYGKYTITKRNFVTWYQWMYKSRLKMHTDFFNWVNDLEKNGENIETLADFGCGIGEGYCDHFKDKCYYGIDMSNTSINWAKNNRTNDKHKYICEDFTKVQLPHKADIVFSSGTLDNCYDVNTVIKNMVENTNKYIYITFFEGWFPNLDYHNYRWIEKQNCYASFLSPIETRKILENLNCEIIKIDSTETQADRKDIPYETLVIAKLK